MACTEYYPSSTTNRTPDCTNCKYITFGGGCTNARVVVAMQRNSVEIKPIKDE